MTCDNTGRETRLVTYSQCEAMQVKPTATAAFSWVLLRRIKIAQLQCSISTLRVSEATETNLHCVKTVSEAQAITTIAIRDDASDPANGHRCSRSSIAIRATRFLSSIRNQLVVQT